MSSTQPYHELSEEPLVAEGDVGIVLVRFEVAVAVNLESPYRYAQEVLWLQVMAEDSQAAAKAASDWVLAGPEEYEATGLVRPTTVHNASLGTDHNGNPLMVFWSTPVLENALPASVVRDPVTGLRVGFVAHPQAEQRWLPREAEGSFRLLSRKPTPSSDPAGLAPLVSQARQPPKGAQS